MSEVTIIPVHLKIDSVANCREHWRQKAKRTKGQRQVAHLYLLGTGAPTNLPATITLTRIGPRDLDDDNLASAFKAVRDGVAGYFGVDDGSKLYTWRYAQRRAAKGEEKYGATITIEREV